MTPQGDQPPDTARLRLNGWKEIANYLDKSVRTVQRWERDYKLPIRRMGREGGEIIFAFREEIDVWSQQSTRPPDAPKEAITVAPASPARIYAAVTMVCFVVLGAGLAWLFRDPIGIASARVEGRNLIARDQQQREIWRHLLDFDPVDKAYSNTPGSGFGLERLIVTDLDKDGGGEVILAVSAVTKSDHQGLRVFNSDGTLRFALEPRPSVRFGSEEYVGPWALYRTFVTDNPDGTRSIWAAFIHGLWFPTLLLEIDARGLKKSQYWSNGYVERVAIAKLNGRSVVLVGGTHNDSQGASLAIFDYGKVHGAAPAQQDRFRCQSCDPGGPSEFLVFPRRCVATAISGQATVTEVWIDEQSRIHALASEGPRINDGFDVGVWYTLNNDFTLQSAAFIPTSARVHGDLEAQGRIDHPFPSLAHDDPGLIRRFINSVEVDAPDRPRGRH